MMPEIRETLVRCEDDTCIHNEYGYCNAKAIDMDVKRDYNYRLVVACTTYRDRREEDV